MKKAHISERDVDYTFCDEFLLIKPIRNHIYEGILGDFRDFIPWDVCFTATPFVSIMQSIDNH